MLTKTASQNLRRQGFVAHQLASGMPEAKVKEVLPKYAALDEKREAKKDELRAAILPPKK